jgi:hypothetical protein
VHTADRHGARSFRLKATASRSEVTPYRMNDLPKRIEHDDVQRLMAEESAQLVEVLPADEFAEEHIIGAINIPLKELDERAPMELDRDRPVIVYCNDYQ